MAEFTIGDRDFLLDGEPHQIISGALHYFRVHPDQWADRIHKARLMGLNTIETYVAWNAHSPKRGEFVTEGGLDLGRFLSLVQAEGMHAIVRPGPYICAEWDNGGFPAWLLRTPDVTLRSSNAAYLDAVTEYLEQVYRIVAPHQVSLGGPVILVQIENEYGAYGNDQSYLAELVRITRDAGITVPLNTVDQPTRQMLADGSLLGVHLTASFGSRSAERFATLREAQPTGPLMCMEFWNGWFDSWGTHHHTTSVEQSANDLETILAAGGSVNLYMFHGGTNFGLTNGANDKGRYLPITTSYDYDAPLDEAGNPTAKYFAFREVIARYVPVPDELPAAGRPAPSLEVQLEPVARPLDEADHGTAFGALPTFEDIHHDGGLVIYRTRLDGTGPGVFTVTEVRDRAWFYLDGVAIGVLSRENHERSLTLPAPRGELTVLVEDQGGVDYGQRIGEPKGLIGPASLDGDPIVDWTAVAIEIDGIPDLAADAAAPAGRGPLVASAQFTLDEASDLFLDTSAWGKGYAWINGFLLGRYWRRGPQHTLYVPAPVTQAGVNTLTVFELETPAETVARFVAAPDLGYEEE